MRDYVVIVLIVSLLPVAAYRPWAGIAIWYWFGLMNPHRYTWGIAYNLPFANWIAVATLLGVFFAKDPKDRKPIPWNGVLVLVIVLVVHYTITTIFAWAPTEAWESWWKVLKIVLFTFLATMFIHGKDRIRIIMLVIGLSIGFHALKGLLYLFTTGFGGRVTGPPNSFVSGNTFIGLAFNMTAPILLVMAREESNKWLRRILYFTFISTVISTIFTYSRGAYIGLAAIVPLMFLQSRQKVVAAIILIPALIIGPTVLPERVFHRVDKIEGYEEDSSANQRLQSWTVAWNLAKDYPLTGAGFNFEYAPDEARWLKYTSEKYAWALQRGTSAAHSIYFQTLGQHGFVGLTLFLLLLLGTEFSLQKTKRLTKGRKDSQWLASYAIGLQIGLVGYMVSGAFLNSANFDLAFLYYALSAILAREAKAFVVLPSLRRPVYVSAVDVESETLRPVNLAREMDVDGGTANRQDQSRAQAESEAGMGSSNGRSRRIP
jgi:putative inorganic carbon (hco3(-)) transporter